jgi:gamma-glutamyltranspeptidase/glutathione hydrolase
MPVRVRVSIIIFLSLFLGCLNSSPKKSEASLYANADYGAVVSANPLATQAGMKILKDGGNAFDAAIATFMSLAVVCPRAGNIGGGGFMVYYTEDGKAGSLDFREKAPNEAARDMYLDEDGNPIEGLSLEGALSVGVPGSVAGMEAIYNKFATLNWSKLLLPAISQAENGFTLSEQQAERINNYYDVLLAQNGEGFYLIKEGKAKEGDRIYAKKLSKSLQLIADQGKDAFYSGPIAEDLVATINSRGGIISMEDLEKYSVVWRDPIHIDFMDYIVISMPPPSSGGIALGQLLYGFDLHNGKQNAYNSSAFIHLNTELERRVYADRSDYLGDPDFVYNPSEMLLDTSYLQERFEKIYSHRATSSQEVKTGMVEEIESVETTHISVIDRWGNAVAITTTLNGNFGSKLATEKGGFLLNNEMDDFSIKPGYPNQFGLIGNEQNAIDAGKRMLSSMTPTIVIQDGRPVLIVGSPGGSTIITSVYQTILASLVYDYPSQEAINLPKYHSQWLPDVLYYEENRSDSLLLDSLAALGHKLDFKPALGKMKVIRVLNGMVDAAGDTLRSDDNAMVE